MTANDTEDPQECRAWLCTVSRNADLSLVTSLNLTGHPVSSLRFLAMLPHVTALCLDNCSVRSLCSLAELAPPGSSAVQPGRLAALSVERNELTSLDGLQSAVGLTVLSVRGNRITSLDGLQALTSLKHLQSLRVADSESLSSTPPSLPADVADPSPLPNAVTHIAGYITFLQSLPSLTLLEDLPVGFHSEGTAAVKAAQAQATPWPAEPLRSADASVAFIAECTDPVHREAAALSQHIAKDAGRLLARANQLLEANRAMLDRLPQ